MKKIAWKVTEMCLPFSRLNGHWMGTEMLLLNTFPVIIESPFEISFCELNHFNRTCALSFCRKIMQLNIFLTWFFQMLNITCNTYVTSQLLFFHTMKILYNYWFLMRFSSCFINPVDSIFTEANGRGKCKISRVDKSWWKPH